MKNPFFSVVIPAYNAEQYLEHCLASVQKQSFRDYEVIVVDDGSTDRTFEISEMIAEDNPCYQVLRKENGGLSSARNAGAAVATGEYLFFLDSDDELDPDAMGIAWRYLQANPVEVLTFGFKEMDEQLVSEKRTWLPPSEETLKREGYSNCLFSGLLENYSWTRIYSKSIFSRQNVYFDENITFLEDIDFTYRVCMSTQSHGFLQKPIYLYRRQKGSMCSTTSVERSLDGLSVLTDVFNNYGVLMQDQALNGLIGTLFMCFDLAGNGSNESHRAKESIYSEIREVQAKTHRCSPVNRIKITLVKLGLYSIARRAWDAIR